MITKEEVLKAQQTWGEGLVALGKLKGDQEAATKAASEAIDTLYAYHKSTVLFKPTKCADIQFRGTKEAALSYFVGQNASFPEDKGFALNPWTNVRFENTDIILEENRAIAMGNYFFTDLEGKDTKVEYTFGYSKDENGNLLIDLHHSSVPFSG